MKRLVVMYADYPGRIPNLEMTCIARAREVCEQVGIDFMLLDNSMINSYMMHSDLGVESLKPNEVADYIAYYSIEALDDRYDKVLKLDTDFYLWSPYILTEIFKLNYSFVGTDSNNRLTDCTVFRNPHIAYRVKGDKLIDLEVFKKYLDEAHTKGRYTATGPALCTTEKVKINDYLVPWTSDMSSFCDEGEYEIDYPSHALGYHFQETMIRALGFNVVLIKPKGSKLVITLFKNK